MQRVFRVVNTAELRPAGLKTTAGFTNNVRTHGVITPILVAEVPDADGVIALHIVDGNRRVRAAQQVGQARVPAVVLKETTPEERARLALICNHLRSLNFYTESLAASALADDADGIAREAKAMGISASKLLGMVRKLEQMPAEVRTAMYDGRLQVSSATDIAGFPRSLQDEVVAKLEQRGWLDTRTVIAMKEDWERRHGPISTRAARKPKPPLPAPPDPWTEMPPVRLDDDVASPATVGGWQVRSVETHRQRAPVAPTASPGAIVTTLRPATATTPRAPLAPETPGTAQPSQAELVRMAPPARPVRPPDEETAASRSPASGSTSLPAAVEAPDRDVADGGAERMTAYVVRLDAAMRDLAREGRALGIDRSVWVDRSMRAWDGAGA